MTRLRRWLKRLARVPQVAAPCLIDGVYQ